MLQSLYFFLKKSKFTYLVIVAIVMAGLASMMMLPRESNPEVKIPYGFITTVYPGASAADVERLVTDEIEDRISTLEDLKSYTSSSIEGASIVTAEFEASADIDDRIRALRDAVAQAEPSLPSEAERPVVKELSFSDTAIVVMALASDAPEADLKRMAEMIQDEIEKISGISEVQIAGVRDQEVIVSVDKTKLDQYDVSISELVSAIQSANISFPVGAIETNDIRYSVRLDAEVFEPELVGNLPVKNVNGIPFYVRDLASVNFDFAEAQTYARVSIDGQPTMNAVTLTVKKKTGGDITKMVDEAVLRAENIRDDMFPEAEITITFDMAKEIKKSLGQLTKNGIGTVIIIMILLFIFLGGREAILSGLAIPMTFLIGFSGLLLLDSSLNFLSLFSLVLALGIVVDSGIVITEGLHEKTKQGIQPMRAAQQTIKEFYKPLISGTLTTVSAFVPMMFMGGIMGAFVKHIPITVNVVLVGSLFVALCLMPLIGAKFLKADKIERPDTIKKRLIDPKVKKLHDWYENWIRDFLKNKKKRKKFVWSLVAGFIFSISLPATGLLKVIMFGESDFDFFYIDVKTSIGTSLDVTDNITRQIEEVLYQDPRVTSFFVNVGAGNAVRDTVTVGATPNIATFTVNIDENRKENTPVILQQFRDKLEFINDAEVKVSQLEDGPPTEEPVVVQFYGSDLNELENLALQAAGIIETIDGTIDVDTSIEEATMEFVLNVNREQAMQYGFSPMMIAQNIRTAVQGIEVSKIRYKGEDINITVKQSLNPYSDFIDDRLATTIDEIEQLTLTSPTGQEVSLATLVNTRLEPGNVAIAHTDGSRRSSATAEITNTTATEVFNRFEKLSENLYIPDGYTMKLGGEAQDLQESFNDLFKSLFLGLFLIASILLLQFNSYRQPFFILMSLPLAIIAIFPGLTLVGLDLSFPAFIGIVALSGVVVNDAIILVDKINQGRKDGLDKFEAVVLAGRARLQPILLTTVTTIGGILPLTLSDPVWAGLGASIIFGLLMATILTLVVVPMMYMRWGEAELENYELV